MSAFNHGNVTGRVARNPVLFKNTDGSQNVKLTVAVERDYKTNDGNRPVDFLSFDGFVPAGRKTNVYNYIAKGDLIAIEYELRSDSYQKNGETVYTQKAVIRSVGLIRTGRKKTGPDANAVADAMNGTPVTPTADEAPLEPAELTEIEQGVIPEEDCPFG